MGPRQVWYLNLDAERELEEPDLVRSRRALARLREQAARLPVPRHDDEAIAFPDDDLAAFAGGDAVAIAWCPTPAALAAFVAAGLSHRAAPSFEALRAANHRALAARIDTGLPEARFVRGAAAVREAVAAPPRVGDGWLLKRPFGFSGRARRVVSGELDEADHTWIEASCATLRGGLQVEPRVEVVQEFGLHGELEATGAFRAGTPTIQRCDASGAFVEARPAAPGEIEAPILAALERARDDVALALHAVQYWGPFGLDAFTWRRPDGGLGLRTVSDVHARFSMGWFVGMGALPQEPPGAPP